LIVSSGALPENGILEVSVEVIDILDRLESERLVKAYGCHVVDMAMRVDESSGYFRLDRFIE
jgi:hypothetical protein